VWFSSMISLLIFLFGWISVGDRAVLRSTTTVLEFIYVFRPFRLGLMKLGALMLSTYRLLIVISFWCIFPFISMECPYLSHLIKVDLKSTLSETNIASPACFQGPLAW
jgi:hypothetical protein